MRRLFEGDTYSSLITLKWQLKTLFHLGQVVITFIEDITRGREDMNFIFEWQNNILLTRCALS